MLKERRGRLKLKLVAGKNALGRKIVISEVNRPGLALNGHLEHFRAERIQIIGRGEQAFCLKSNPKILFSNLSKILSRPNLPCLIVTHNQDIPATLTRACKKFNVPLLHSPLDTATLVGEMTAFLEDRLAPVERIHGVLVNVYGLGVLIQGDSGIGKSECAIELLKRGHIAVADDVVEIQKRRGDILIGSCPDSLKHYMEVRGLGILDLQLIFGIGAILNQTRIELVVFLEAWRAADMTSYERAGLETKTANILGVELPAVRIPVTPGRNLAILIEVAALNQRLRSQGYFSAQAFNEKLIKKMTRAHGRRG